MSNENSIWISSGKYMPPLDWARDSNERLILHLWARFNVKNPCESGPLKCRRVSVQFILVKRYAFHDGKELIPFSYLSDENITDIDWMCENHPLGNSDLEELKGSIDVPENIEIEADNTIKWILLKYD